LAGAIFKSSQISFLCLIILCSYAYRKRPLMHGVAFLVWILSFLCIHILIDRGIHAQVIRRSITDPRVESLLSGEILVALAVILNPLSYGLVRTLLNFISKWRNVPKKS
jgi:hypothetical protein